MTIASFRRWPGACTVTRSYHGGPRTSRNQKMITLTPEADAA